MISQSHPTKDSIDDWNEGKKYRRSLRYITPFADYSSHRSIRIGQQIPNRDINHEAMKTMLKGGFRAPIPTEWVTLTAI